MEPTNGTQESGLRYL